jgi:hypothetical protein
MRTMRACSATGLVLSALGIFIALAQVRLWSQAREDGKPVEVFLADGTPVHLLLMDDLQGKKLVVKQTVHFKVREDLLVGSKLIVRTGAEAIGHIESISKSGLLGKSGRLVLQFDHLDSIAGTRIPLRGNAGVTGGKGGALTWESALWYGPDANLPVGTMINAYVNQDQRIPIH